MSAGHQRGAAPYGSESGADDGRHQCPVRRCEQLVGPDKLMCPGHWRMVPGPIRRAVWAAWRNGAGAGTPAHRAAIRRAIQAVSDRLEAGR